MAEDAALFRPTKSQAPCISCRPRPILPGRAFTSRFANKLLLTGCGDFPRARQGNEERMAQAAAIGADATAEKPKSKRKLILMIGGPALVLVLGGGLWFSGILPRLLGHG